MQKIFVDLSCFFSLIRAGVAVQGPLVTSWRTQMVIVFRVFELYLSFNAATTKKVNRFHSYLKMKPPPLTMVRLHVIHKRLMRYCFNLVYHRPTRLLLRDIYLCVCLLCMTGVKEFAKLFFALPQMFNFFPREYICNLFSDAFRAYQPLISSPLSVLCTSTTRVLCYRVHTPPKMR